MRLYLIVPSLVSIFGLHGRTDAAGGATAANAANPEPVEVPARWRTTAQAA
jgi:hypothetical protein